MAVIINSATINNLNGFVIKVEVEIFKGLPSFTIVGLADQSIKESKERIRAAIVNSGFKFPLGRIVINLAPANLKKIGSLLDLPMSIGILISSGQIEAEQVEEYIIAGELSLSGDIKEIKGLFPILEAGIDGGFNKFIIPRENSYQSSFFYKGDIFDFDELKGVINYLTYKDQLPSEKIPFKINKVSSEDLSEIIGQESVLRAAEIAAAGFHNISFYGPPGAGKTLIANKIANILPEMSYEEAAEIFKIYSTTDISEEMFKNVRRPFRNPHHSCTSATLVGGGIGKVGEVTLAHNGVLFLDEFLQFNKECINQLREPLENREVQISRLNNNVKLPANFMLITAFNPCPCGWNLSFSKDCMCSDLEKKRYLSKLSKPILDRIDIFTYVPRVDISKRNIKNQKVLSKKIIKNIKSATEIQNIRYQNEKVKHNANVKSKDIMRLFNVDNEALDKLEAIYDKFNLSMRGYYKILKISRTIADLNGEEALKASHIYEALSYRKFIDGEVI
ncbi:YifB family Mg chelatase-like AAA ATPase [Clostridium intestinale]|uniref:YifB family Mg chelatase-like AAA ATPase n=1 Tax=Clostridium intestinale TaxID=36845 RepID=UPI0028EC5291|nr:YifB family Mg chelatase-like AAA ATPase [Clostridium intestinale]